MHVRASRFISIWVSCLAVAVGCDAPGGGGGEGQGTVDEENANAEQNANAQQPETGIEITDVDLPARFTGGGDPADLIVTWTGNAVFPVTALVRPATDGCPEGTECLIRGRSFEIEQHPLILEEIIWCEGFEEEIEFGFEVVLVDANGVGSNPFPAPFTCVPP